MSDLTIDDEGAVTSRSEWLAAGSSTSFGCNFLSESGLTFVSQERERTRADYAKKWKEFTQDRILDSLALEEDWDSYGSPSPDLRAGREAGRLTEWLAQTWLAQPRLRLAVPRVEGTSEAGLSMEWYQPERQLRFVIGDSGAEVTVFFRDLVSNESWEAAFNPASESLWYAISKFNL